MAVQLYYERIMREIYHRDPQTGQLLNLTPALRYNKISW